MITDQGRLPCDLALGVLPNVPVEVVRQSPLVAADGWIHVNRRTLETDFENVYAIGDCIKIPVGNDEPLPQAGLMAEKEGEVVAKRIAARLAGQAPTTMFEGDSEISAAYFFNPQGFEAALLKKWFGE